MSQATSQTAVGLARGKFDCVTFDLSVEAQATTGPAAKNKAQEVISKSLKAGLDKLQKMGVVFEKDDGQTGFSVSRQYTYVDGAQRHAGYKADFTMHLETKQVERVSEIQDVLTSIDGVSVSNPNFLMKPENRRNLQKFAVKEAVTVAKARFEEECQILGLNPKDFEIGDWEVQYSRSNHSSRISNAAYEAVAASADASDTGSIDVQSGLADVQVSLTVGFRRVGS